MSDTKYVKVGKVHSTQGLKGQLFVMIFSGESPWKDDLSVLALGGPDDVSPSEEYPVETLRVHRKQKYVGLAVKLKGFDSIESVEPLLKKSFFIPVDMLVSEDGEAIYLREIEGFRVIDASRGEVGIVSEFSDNGAQDLIVVRNGDGETFEVPLVEPILQKIDFDGSTVFMDIPLGLVFGEDL